MGDENRCFECRETCGCHDDGDGNILGLLILLVVLYFIFCNNSKGGILGNLF